MITSQEKFKFIDEGLEHNINDSFKDARYFLCVIENLGDGVDVHISSTLDPLRQKTLLERLLKELNSKIS